MKRYLLIYTNGSLSIRTYPSTANKWLALGGTVADTTRGTMVNRDRTNEQTSELDRLFIYLSQYGRVVRSGKLQSVDK